MTDQEPMPISDALASNFRRAVESARARPWLATQPVEEREQILEAEIERLRAMIFDVVDGQGEDYYAAVRELRRWALEQRRAASR